MTNLTQDFPSIVPPTQVYTKTFGSDTFVYPRAMTCEETSVFESAEFTGKYGGLQTWLAQDLLMGCNFPTGQGMFSGFDTLNDVSIFDKDVFIAGGVPFLLRFRSDDWSYRSDAKAITWYVKDLLPDAPNNHPRKYELFSTYNGGGRGMATADENEVCNAGNFWDMGHLLHSVSRRRQPLRISDDHHLPARKRPCYRERRHPFMVCYRRGFEDLEEPTHVYKVTREKMRSVWQGDINTKSFPLLDSFE